METVRRNMLIFRYQLLHTRKSRRELSNTLQAVMPDFQRYIDFVKQIKEKAKERRDLLAEKKSTPILRIPRHTELSRQIAAITEDMEELKSEKAILLNRFDKTDDTGMNEIKQRVDSMEASLKNLENADARFSANLESALAEYRELQEKATDMDVTALADARAELRPGKTDNAIYDLRTTYPKSFDYRLFQRVTNDVSAMLGEETPSQER